MSAQEFAARILAAIDRLTVAGAGDDYCRERVASDVRAIERAEEGLRDSHYGNGMVLFPGHARRYAEARDDAWASLRLTGSLYGVAERDPLGKDYVCPQCGPDPRGGTAHQEANHLP